MAKGGYHILSLQNKNIVIGGDAVVIPGIYESLEGSYRKVQLLSDVVINGTECYDRYVVFGNTGGHFVSQISIDDNIYLLELTITQDDEVKIEQN